jgi:hypothetical protein
MTLYKMEERAISTLYDGNILAMQTEYNSVFE